MSSSKIVYIATISLFFTAIAYSMEKKQNSQKSFTKKSLTTSDQIYHGMSGSSSDMRSSDASLNVVILPSMHRSKSPVTKKYIEQSSNVKNACLNNHFLNDQNLKQQTKNSNNSFKTCFGRK